MRSSECRDRRRSNRCRSRATAPRRKPRKAQSACCPATSAARPRSFPCAVLQAPPMNMLYNGIWIGPGDITSRIMETANLDQIEFLKGPSALMSGLDAIGGSVNFVSRQPHTGPDQERARHLDRFARHLSHAFRFGREHQHFRPRLSFRCLLIQGQRLYRWRRRPAQQFLGATQLPRQRCLQSVRRGRLQARRRPRLLGDAVDHQAFSGPFSTRRRFGIGH